MTLALSMHEGEAFLTTVTTTAAREDARDAEASFAGMIASMRFTEPPPQEAVRVSTVVPAPTAIDARALLFFPMPGVGRGGRPRGL